MKPKQTVLIVDDDDGIRKQISWSLREEFQVLEAADHDHALDRVRRHSVDLVLLDLRFPPYSTEITGGKLILEGIQKLQPAVPVIIMTADTDRDTAVEMLARGAFDLFRKPVNLQELMVVMRRALRMRNLEEEARRLRSRLETSFGLDRLIGKSPAMQAIARLVRKVADTNATVLITGESGTGKELVAQSLHQLSGRRDAAFVALNCSAIPETLVDDELFGHEKGSFTGAGDRRIGKFEFADGGTLFLDEVGDLPEPVQRKLLRVLQESRFERLGGNQTIAVDVRLVAATHQNLGEASRAGAFREDLFYRLNVVHLTLPPLRERLEDLSPLIDHFLKKHGTPDSPRSVAPDAMELLRGYRWPGNVRELENLINSLCVTAEGKTIETRNLPEPIRSAPGESKSPSITLPTGGISLEETEKELVRQALERTGGNRTRTAQLLGISRHVLLGKLKKYRLDS